jgi:NADH-quinone oxidoreductase subunit L
MPDIKTLLILIPALPLAAAALTALPGRRGRGRWDCAPVVAAIVLSFIAAVTLALMTHRQFTPHALGEEFRPICVELLRWADIDAVGAGKFNISLTLSADPLTALMLVVVTCVSALVAIYSIGYMRGDEGRGRFFSYVGLFVFSMTTLVEASNFLLLYVCWELVGLCSYLLIGFWYERPAAAAAGKKAFLVNRVGDVGFALGVFLIWTSLGTLDFQEVFHEAWTGGLAGDWRATTICLLLLAGACGKSAQFPLHVWLPDAMEGPTPVSALIHAATMVTAGVYMIARCAPLFVLSPTAQMVVAGIGGITALLGAIIAITQTDLKRILAYSTISHLGYMFVALGTCTLAGMTAAMFHLTTHAFFKALLFLAAGSVMHAAGGVIDIRRLGGLRRLLPITYWTFLIGALSIVGLAPLAGFWSKDAILLALHGRFDDGGGELYGLLFLTVLAGVPLADFYIFRPFMMVFHGPEKIPPEAAGHPHESPRAMTWPLIILAFAAATAGLYFHFSRGLFEFLAATPSWQCFARQPAEHATAGVELNIAVAGTVLTLLGVAAACWLYSGRMNTVERLARAMNIFGLYTLSFYKFFLDPIYTAVVVYPLLGLARLASWLDRRLIDGAVESVGRLPALFGTMARPLQNGVINSYALAMALGVLALAVLMLM